jgi:molecular chaperone HtpG
MTQEQHQFQIYLPGLLKVLAESLYSNEKVAIRELLQNAHDSTVRRSVETKDTRYKPRIEVKSDRTKNSLKIQDNGAGLTEPEIREYLSTIGRSYTRQLGEKLTLLSPDQADKLIGQFGLGFLSAFLVATEVILTTRSYKEGSTTFQWRSSGDAHYTIVPQTEEHPVGTTVELILKPVAQYLMSKHSMTSVVQQYADFLPVPIVMEGDYYPANSMTPPWESVDTTLAINEYVQSRYKSGAPLLTIPLVEHSFSLGHDDISFPLSGFLYIPQSTEISLQEYGDVSIYIRRMFICDNVKDLLPSWARFVRGAVECTQLQPTASREDLQREGNFNMLQRAIEAQLLAALRKVAQEDPSLWRQIVLAHSNVIMQWATREDEFFNQISDFLVFKTSKGLITMQDYLKQSDNNIYYTTRRGGALQEQVLSESSNRPLIDATHIGEAQFIYKYTLLHPEIKAVQMDDPTELLHPAPESDFLTLLAFFRQKDIKARISNFEPKDIPALMVYPKNAETLQEARSAVDEGVMPSSFANMLLDYLSRSSGDDDTKGTLHINVSNPLIQHLATMTDEAARNAVLQLIYQVARFFNGRLLRVNDVMDAFKDITASFQNLTKKD